MFNRLALDIYAADLTAVMIAILIIFIVWSFLGAVCYKRMRIIGAVAAVAAAAVILYMTVLSRSVTVSEHHWIPFSSFKRASVQPEMYRSMLMNVLLFFPLGFSLPFVFGGSTAKRILLTVLAGFVLSVSVEVVQYFFSLGMSDADDVVCNALGTALGSCSLLISNLLIGLKDRFVKGKPSDE